MSLSAICCHCDLRQLKFSEHRFSLLLNDRHNFHVFSEDYEFYNVKDNDDATY